MRQRILSLAFLAPTASDHFLNRVVAQASEHGVCHVELVYEDDMAFSIFAGGTVFLRPRTLANPNYHIVSILVSNAEYSAARAFCESAIQHEIGFTDYGMYMSYLQPKSCPFLNTRGSIQAGRTFCSKIVAEALQFAGVEEVAHLIPCTTTPSCLYAAFIKSDRKVLSTVTYKRQLLLQGSVV